MQQILTRVGKKIKWLVNKKNQIKNSSLFNIEASSEQGAVKIL